MGREGKGERGGSARPRGLKLEGFGGSESRKGMKMDPCILYSVSARRKRAATQREKPKTTFLGFDPEPPVARNEVKRSRCLSAKAGEGYG